MRITRYFIALCVGWAVPVASATVFTLDTTIGPGNDAIAATAEFSWSGDTLQLRLSNTTDSIAKIIQELTGITFVLSGTPALQSVSGLSEGSVNCIGVAAGTPCNFDSAGVDPFGAPPNLDGHGANPSGWGFLPNYALFTFAAGGGSFKPYGIVNDSIVGSGSNGGTSNAPHNPMLLGPVDFDFVFAPFDVRPTITGVQFYWGTGGDHRGGTLCTSVECADPSGDPSVPEPQTLALLGLALFAMSAFTRRRPAA